MFEHLAPPSADNSSYTTGKCLITQPKTRPNYLPWISYADTDIIQALATLVMCCPAVLVCYSAITRYVFREFEQEEICQLCPFIGKAVQLSKSSSAPWNNEVFLFFTRTYIKNPLLHEVLHLCLIDLIRQLNQKCITQVHFLIYDPQLNILPTWYAMLRGHFKESKIEIVLHDRVYVSIASATRTHGRYQIQPIQAPCEAIGLSFELHFLSIM